MLLLPATASAVYTTSAECLVCHDTAGSGATSKVSFGTGSGTGGVDYAACKACHGIGMTGKVVNYSHSHNVSRGSDCIRCHKTFPGNGNPLWLPFIEIAGSGYFATADSLNTPTSNIHAIHVNGSWPKNVNYYSGMCGGCHAPAACSACHVGQVPHAPHAASVLTAVSYQVAIGQPAGALVPGLRTDTITCVSSGCHVLVAAAAPGFKPFCATTCHKPPMDTADRTLDHGYGAVDHTATVGAQIDTGEVKPCGACHAMDLMTEHARSSAAGPHTCATCHPSPRDTIPVGTAWNKTCSQNGCHAASTPTAKHGNLASAHATITISAPENCYACHEGDLAAIHSGSAKSCLACHSTTSVPTTKNCLDAACHATYHAGMDTKHSSLSSGCTGAPGCHPSTKLPENHALYVGSGTANPQYADTCSLCHNNPLVDVTKGGGCGSCHDGNGFPADYHYKQNHRATSTPSAECVACHGATQSPSNNNWVVGIHGADGTSGGTWAKCATCHNNPTKGNITWNMTSSDCEGCHAAKRPVLSNHYVETSHTATPFLALFQDPTGAVPRDDEECSKCHSALLPTAHATTSTNGGSVTCVECHTDTSLNSAATIAGGWATKRCTECHDHGSVSTHDGYAAAHAVAAGTCAGTGTSCHVSTDLAVLHATSWLGGAPKYAGCLNGGCHTRDHRPNPVSKPDSCGQNSGGCHDNKTQTNHGGTHNLDIGGSDYVPATITGCTNSGAGCHGSETRPTTGITGIANYADPYHPANGCISGACHTSPTKALNNHKNPLTCQACHDGTYSGAPNVSMLQALSSAGGHYSETLHTAGAASVTGQVSSGGSAKATCVDCHPNTPSSGLKQLYAQHQNLANGSPSTGCFACHNYNTAVTAVVTGSWAAKTCAECHNATAMTGKEQHASNAPAVTTGSLYGGCAMTGTGCHPTSDLHAIHKNAAGGCNLADCHDYTKQAFTPTKTTCAVGGACHVGFMVQDHKNLGTAHLATAQASLDCAACHQRTATSSVDIDALHQTQYGCASAWCHDNPTRVDFPNVTAECATCHSTSGTYAYHKSQDASHTYNALGTDCQASGCHVKRIDTEHAKYAGPGSRYPQYATACVMCHANADPNRIPAGATAACSSCHPGSAHPPHLPSSSDFCIGSGCHDGSTGDLLVIHANSVKGACAVCHNNNGTDLTLPKDGNFNCVQSGCHVPTPHANHVATASSQCTACHTAAASTDNGVSSVHPDCATCHANPTKGDLTHNTPSVVTYECAQTGCHANLDAPDPNHYSDTTHTASPFTAYFQRSTFDAGGKECTLCHTATLKSAHAKTSTSGGSVTCVECHTNTTRNSKSVIASGWTSQQCVQCHDYGTPKTHATYGTVHAVNTGACAVVGCHTEADLAKLHDKSFNGGAPTHASCANVGCHDAKDERPAAFKTPSSCGQGSTGCHLDKTPTNHGGTHNLDVTGSNYSNATVAGCTNSGAGCHLAETRPLTGATGFANYENPYHPANGCTTGLCHTSASKSTHINPLTCQACHDGTYTNAPHVDVLAALSTAGGHYPETLHTAGASDLTGLATSGGTISAACTKCHANAPTSGLKQLNAQHQALPSPYVSTTCADCHNYNAAVSAVVKASWTAKTCAACHNSTAMPTAAQHASLAPAVLGTSADGCGASGVGCHTTYDLHALHKGTASSGTTLTVGGCAISGCHDFTKQALKPTKKTCGTGGTCHATPTYHPAHIAKASATCLAAGCHVTSPAGDVLKLHAASTLGKCAVCHSNPTGGDLTVGKTTFECAQSGCHAGVTGNHHELHNTTGVIDPGCAGCHFTYLDDEHLKLKNASGVLYTCGTCHSSTNAAVVAAISGHKRNCTACHPAVNGKNRHAALNTLEFIAGNSGGHNATSTLNWARSAFMVGGVTYTWPLPAASSFLKTGWTTNSVVTCDKCHTFSGTATGPHGAAVTVNIDPAYTADWHTATSFSSTTLLCNKCHTNLSRANDVHADSEHSGDQCVDCHAGIPHGWRLPRLLAYTTDPAPYASHNLTSIKLKNYTPTSWNKDDCGQSGCEEHNRSVSPIWPSAVQVPPATLTGTVKSSTGAALSGATVAVTGDGSTTTGSTGGYTLTLAAGTYTITASATGYTPVSKTVTLTSAQAAALDFVLTLAPVPQNVALNKAFSASSQYSTTYAPSKAGDGLTTTWWRSIGSLSWSTQTQWLQVDLGSAQTINKAVVYWYSSYYARAYRVQVSTNGTTWTDVYSTSSGTSGTKTHSFTATSARYVRVYCTTYATSSGYAISELEVWTP
jgi:hypothetical protein